MQFALLSLWKLINSEGRAGSQLWTRTSCTSKHPFRATEELFVNIPHIRVYSIIMSSTKLHLWIINIYTKKCSKSLFEGTKSRKKKILFAPQSETCGCVRPTHLCCTVALIFSLRLPSRRGEIRLTAASSSLLSLASSLLWCPAEERASLLRLASVPSDCRSPSWWKTDQKKRDADTSQTTWQPAVLVSCTHCPLSNVTLTQCCTNQDVITTEEHRERDKTKTLKIQQKKWPAWLLN